MQPLNFVTLLLIYVMFILGSSIIVEFLQSESYVDITNEKLKDTLAEFKKEFKDDLYKEKSKQEMDNYEKYTMDQAQEKLEKLGNYNIVDYKPDFKNLNERFNDFGNGIKPDGFFCNDAYHAV